MKKPPIIAVITGDVIDSGSLPEETKKNLPQRIEEALALAKRVPQEWKASSIDVFRGESWQLYSENPWSVFSLGLVLKCAMRALLGFDTRLSIGFGRATTLEESNPSRSQGEAFECSGRALDELEAGQTISVCVGEDLGVVRELLAANAMLLDLVVSRWTDKQAEAVFYAWTGQPHDKLGGRMNPPITKQAFGQHLAAARWEIVRKALVQIQTSLRKHIAHS